MPQYKIMRENGKEKLCFSPYTTLNFCVLMSLGDAYKEIYHFVKEHQLTLSEVMGAEIDGHSLFILNILLK